LRLYGELARLLQFAASFIESRGLPMRRLTVFADLIAITLMSLAIGSPVAVQAQIHIAALPLTPCKFDVGLGDGKYQIDARCGTLDVPENYAQPNGRKLTLHFDILPPLKANAQGLPIFHLEGGPGGSAISNFGQAWFASYQMLRQDHPVVLIDQRGIGQSASLQCTEITSKAFDDLAATTATTAQSSVALQRLSDCLTRLSKTADPQFYTTNALADDTDAIRAALGYDQIELFGNSYGTSLGQIYLKRHGDHVAGLVLDSVTGPWNYWTLDAANNGQASLDKLFALCQADTLCNTAYPDLAGQLQTALKNLTQKPVQITALSLLTATPYRVGMTSDKLRSALFELLYNPANATIIPSAINSAAKGGYAFPAGILIAEAEQADQAVSLGLYQSIICSEIVPFYTPALISQYQSDNTFSAINTPADDKTGCDSWRSGELSAADVAPVTSDRPVLILSGNLDPITPVKFGQETHARLSHSTLATFPYQGHGVLPNSKCAQTITAAFLNAPDQKLDISCAQNDLKPLFVGAYQVEMVPFNGADATFSGSAPKDWVAEQVGPLTFFTSPDGLQFAAEGILKNQTAIQAQQTVLDALIKRYGAINVQQVQTVNALIVSITAVAHSLDRPDYAYTGSILLRAEGTDTYAIWQAAPTNWLQAVSAVISPQLLVNMKPR
jgi:pimeloyl-ACP methyl ester carboxylesterase